jgi:hypothetical protein
LEKKVVVVLFKVRCVGEGDVCVTTGIANAPRRALSAMMLYEELTANVGPQLASQGEEVAVEDELRSLAEWLC